uniref:Uncharacterized protein n=1 Tax=viral metagenome TaxID=1070528 RepID=A0A6C0CHC2_9ZZZZ
MKSLQELSLLEATKRMETLGEVLDFCEADETMSGICAGSAIFWKDTLTRILGKTIVLQRGDLATQEEWSTFAKLLDQGLTYKYSIASDANGIDIHPLPFYRVQNRRDGRNGIERYPLEIPGLVPLVGSSGFFISIFMRGYREHNQTNFFLGELGSLLASQNLIRYAAELCIDWYEPFDLAGEMVWVDDEETEMPNVDFFEEEIAANMTNQGSDGILGIRWKNPISNKDYRTEIFWTIRPITF